MLHKETVEAGTLALIQKLAADERLKDFVLVGGTALSLQMGHRKSLDIDLFTASPLEPGSVAKHLESAYGAEGIVVLKNAIFSYIDGIKTDMLTDGRPWIRPIQEIEGIRMASIDDLAAMKLNAIVGNGTRLKDFVDIHTLFEHRSLEKMTGAYAEKYEGTNAAIARNALLYHTEIKFSTSDLHLLNRTFNWKEIVQRQRAAIAAPKKVFEAKSIQEERNKGYSQGRGKAR